MTPFQRLSSQSFLHLGMSKWPNCDQWNVARLLERFLKKFENMSMLLWEIPFCYPFYLLYPFLQQVKSKKLKVNTEDGRETKWKECGSSLSPSTISRTIFSRCTVLCAIKCPLHMALRIRLSVMCNWSSGPLNFEKFPNIWAFT